jgi:hypothetical protein
MSIAPVRSDSYLSYLALVSAFHGSILHAWGLFWSPAAEDSHDDRAQGNRPACIGQTHSTFARAVL